MPRLRLSALSLAVIGSLVTRAELSAQRQSFLAVDLTLGGSMGRGGGDRYDGRVAVSADLAAVLRFREATGHAPVFGLALTGAGRTWGSDVCRILRDGTCATSFPGQSIRSVLVGWEWLDRSGFAVRAFLAPSWDVTPQDGTDSRTRLHLRADIATPAMGAFSVVSSVRGGALVSGPRGFTMVTGGLGVRIR